MQFTYKALSLTLLIPIITPCHSMVLQNETTRRDIEYLTLLIHQKDDLYKHSMEVSTDDLRMQGERLFVAFDLAMAPIDYQIKQACETNAHTICFNEAMTLEFILHLVASADLIAYVPTETKNYLVILVKKWVSLYEQAHQGLIAAPASDKNTRTLLALCDEKREESIKRYIRQLLHHQDVEVGDLSALFKSMRQNEMESLGS